MWLPKVRVWTTPQAQLSNNHRTVVVATCTATVLRVPASPRLLAHLRPRRRRPAHLRMVAGVRAATHIRTIPAMHIPTTLATGIRTGIRTPTRRRMLRCARCLLCWALLAQSSLRS